MLEVIKMTAADWLLNSLLKWLRFVSFDGCQCRCLCTLGVSDCSEILTAPKIASAAFYSLAAHVATLALIV